MKDVLPVVVYRHHQEIGVSGPAVQDLGEFILHQICCQVITINNNAADQSIKDILKEVISQ